MLTGEIVSIKFDRGFFFVEITDPTSEHFQLRLFCHANSLRNDSVPFDEARLHDHVAFSLEEGQRGKVAVDATIKARVPGERVQGRIAKFSGNYGFASIDGEYKLTFFHSGECAWDVTQADVGAAITCELVTTVKGPACQDVRREG
jgi:hypothetical protein